MPVGNKETLESDGEMKSSSLKSNLLRGYPYLEEIFSEKNQLRIRILMVADGDVNFGDASFGLREFVTKALAQTDPPWAELDITTAHRGQKEEGRHADDFNFKFDTDGLNIESYDQVWLFGYKGQDSPESFLTPTELKALSEFMNKGGGVFAAGDHLDLGYAMCGKVPRVRNMRKWCIEETPEQPCPDPVPDRGGMTRHDTVQEGRDCGFQASDESDDVPQKLLAKLYSRDGHATYPHPLLTYGANVINVLPDHMHEGECIEPHDLEAKLQYADGPEFEEYPKALNTDIRICPEVIATSISAGGGFGTLPAVDPRCFGAISAYDGHSAGVGRVVTDASFHHFVNMNLKGTGTLTTGFYIDGKPTKDYEVIKQYYRNLVNWLNPHSIRRRYYVNLLLGLRYIYPLNEELRRVEEYTPKNILEVGSLTRKAISQYLSPAEAVDCVLTLYGEPDFDSMLFRLTHPWLPKSLRTDFSLLFNAQIIPTTCLGVAMLEIVRQFPQNPYQASRALSEIESQQGGLSTIICDGIARMANTLSQTVEKWFATFSELSETFAEGGVMADKCKTKKADKTSWWESKIYPDGSPEPPDFNDGLIGVYNKTNSTALTGHHEKSGKELENVRCTGSGIEDLSFTRTEGSHVYLYEGRVRIHPHDDQKHIVEGRYHRFPLIALTAKGRLKKNPPPPDEEGTWQGQKPIT
jgi:hypothetical protein